MIKRLNNIKNENTSGKELPEELQKHIIRKLRKRKVNSFFIDNTWGSDVANLQLISKFNQRFRFLYSVIDTVSKYLWVIVLKGKTGITSTNRFQKILNQSNCKPNKI